ncbi:MAG TPA: hypothetical protein VMS40_00130 [Vicinamibacterales bacterium]|nr:hypothetical protein [Vicinamibacterales bacterium]
MSGTYLYVKVFEVGVSGYIGTWGWRLSKLDMPVQNRMMVRAIVRRGVVVEESVHMIEPDDIAVGRAATSGDALHVALAEMACKISHLLGS